MKPIALSPLETYKYKIMETKDILITEQVYYGGEDSKSVPCGFVTEYVYDKKKPKKRSLDKRLRAVANKLDKPSSTKKPHG